MFENRFSLAKVGEDEEGSHMLLLFEGLVAEAIGVHITDELLAASFSAAVENFIQSCSADGAAACGCQIVSDSRVGNSAMNS